MNLRTILRKLGLTVWASGTSASLFACAGAASNSVGIAVKNAISTSSKHIYSESICASTIGNGFAGGIAGIFIAQVIDHYRLFYSDRMMELSSRSILMASLCGWVALINPLTQYFTNILGYAFMVNVIGQTTMALQDIVEDAMIGSAILLLVTAAYTGITSSVNRIELANAGQEYRPIENEEKKSIPSLLR